MKINLVRYESSTIYYVHYYEGYIHLVCIMKDILCTYLLPFEEFLTKKSDLC